MNSTSKFLHIKLRAAETLAFVVTAGTKQAHRGYAVLWLLDPVQAEKHTGSLAQMNNTAKLAVGCITGCVLLGGGIVRLQGYFRQSFLDPEHPDFKVIHHRHDVSYDGFQLHPPEQRLTLIATVTDVPALAAAGDSSAACFYGSIDMSVSNFAKHLADKGSWKTASGAQVHLTVDGTSLVKDGSTVERYVQLLVQHNQAHRAASHEGKCIICFRFLHVACSVLCQQPNLQH